MPASSHEGSRSRILDHLKRHGSASVPDLAGAFGVSVETVRSQVKALVAEGLVTRSGARREGPGRPELVWGLTQAAEAFFPRREGEILRGFADYLQDQGRQEVLSDYLMRFAAQRRDRALARLEGLEGSERLSEVAEILTEEGYMAEVVEGGEQDRLRLCHCPLRELVDVTKAPCRAEVGLVRALVGEHLTRVEYLPDGDHACTYAVKHPEAGPGR